MAKAKKLETKKEVSTMNLNKAIELNKESEASLRKHKFPNHADAVQIGIEAIKRVQDLRAHHIIGPIRELPGEDSIEDKGPSAERIKKVRESPIGKKPKACYKVNDVPQTIFSITAAQLQAMSFYRRLTHRQDRQARYTLLTFAGATPKQAYRWRDWSIKHFQLVFDYLFNPEPLADDLVNNRLGLSEEGLKSVAVA